MPTLFIAVVSVSSVSESLELWNFKVDLNALLIYSRFITNIYRSVSWFKVCKASQSFIFECFLSRSTSKLITLQTKYDKIYLQWKFFLPEQTALHWAAKHGNENVIKLIAGRFKADVNSRTVSRENTVRLMKC